MRVLVLLLAACGGGKPFTPGAGVSVDGTAVDLPAITAMQTGTLFELSATADDGSVMTLAFPTDAPVGTRSCSEGAVAGLITLDYTDAMGIKFASYFPSANPPNDCTFDLVTTGDTIEIEAIGGALMSSDGFDTLTLADGTFRARVR
jgi:hypothetical protein